MNIALGNPIAISEKGRRSHNEDAIYPSSELADLDQKLFIVCDGVGGAEKGEIASSLACESIQTFFSTFLEGDPSPAFIHKAIQYTETQFDEYTTTHPEAKGMATTMTLIYIGDSTVMLAHIGDSRIYQFRNGQTVFQTNDHSLVNTYVNQGILSPEEAFNHPQKNIITRAIQGTNKLTEADIVSLIDIQPGDYLFMCTDGVTDCMSNDMLSNLFTEKLSPVEIKNEIVEICSEQSRDNYSFYILPIQCIQNSTNYKQILSSFFYIFT